MVSFVDELNFYFIFCLPSYFISWGAGSCLSCQL